jgi:hypothetical protein
MGSLKQGISSNNELIVNYLPISTPPYFSIRATYKGEIAYGWGLII